MTARIPSAWSATRSDWAWLSVLKLATALIGGGGGGPLHPAHAHRKLHEADGRAPDANFSGGGTRLRRVREVYALGLVGLHGDGRGASAELLLPGFDRVGPGRQVFDRVPAVGPGRREEGIGQHPPHGRASPQERCPRMATSPLPPRTGARC